MSKKRVVVTGMGIVSCFGNDVHAFYQKLLAGESGVGPISLFDCADYPTRFAAEVKDFDPGHYIDKKQARRVDRCISFSLVAGKRAMEMAKLFPEVPEHLDKSRCGVIIGSGIGGMSTFAENVQILNEKGHRKITPFLIPFILTNMGSGLLAMDVGFMGPNYSISTACATSNNCIIAAAEHIRNGEADVMVCGGSEAPLSPIGLAGFCALKALSTRNDAPADASRPWDKNRDGFVMAEGAGILVLESLEHAQKRNAPIFAEYLGGALSCDAHHMTDPRKDGAGISLCLNKALVDAGITADKVDYINAHATSTPAGDMCEITGCLDVFKQPERIVLNSTKSMIGHSLGAAGGLEAIAVIQAILTGMIHPNRNLEDAEDIPFQLPRTAMSRTVETAVSNSFGFGGHNSAVIFGRWRN
ncbi:MAG: beta-ketoacyl-ACP synthase II [Verrucomicrobia bacterium]|nr:beta-ketoacyl-ACP synthase II [Verrucomicrobiota bacterium]